MLKKIISILHKYRLLIIGIVLISVANNIHWGKDKFKKIIESDGKGYYAYLPAVFIYQDLNFGFFDQMEATYSNEHLYYDYRQNIDGKFVNKYYCGTAITELPFFFIAHLHSWLSDKPLDGYSKYYPIWINVGAVLYLLLGLFFFGRILTFFDITNSQTTLLFFAITFGTNAFVYSVLDPGMSHIYSFALIAIFMYYALVLFQKFTEPPVDPLRYRRLFFGLAFLLGLIVLIRPINGLILLATPFLAVHFERFKRATITLFTHPKIILPCLFLFLGVVSLQFIIYKIQTGHFLIYSYAEEGFNFRDPHIFDILFSYKKGLFVYTPLAFAALFGLYYIFKNNTYQFWSFTLFFFILTYFLSSWWNWWYGGSFSSRVFLEYLPMLFIPLALLLKNSAQYVLRKNMLQILIVTLVIICQIQIYQFRYFIIHYENMTQEMYWDKFLKIKK